MYGFIRCSYPLDVSLLLNLQELQQLGSCSVVPDQIRVLRVAIQQLQDLKAQHVELSMVLGIMNVKH